MSAAQVVETVTTWYFNQLWGEHQVVLPFAVRMKIVELAPEAASTLLPEAFEPEWWYWGLPTNSCPQVRLVSFQFAYLFVIISVWTL